MKTKMGKDTIDKRKKNTILDQAEKCLYYNELLIEQCDNWLSVEEGNANMLKAIREKRKNEAGISKTKKINRILRFFGIKNK